MNEEFDYPEDDPLEELVPSYILNQIYEDSIRMAKKCPDLVADFRMAIEKEDQKVRFEGDGY